MEKTSLQQADENIDPKQLLESGKEAAFMKGTSPKSETKKGKKMEETAIA